jgi:hypothetical protein
MEQQEPWVLLTQGHLFPWHFRVKLAGHVVGEKCGALSSCLFQEAGLTTERPSNGAWRHMKTSGVGMGVLSCEQFFPFFPWLVASPFEDLESALLLTDYGTPWVPFGVPSSSFAAGL